MVCVSGAVVRATARLAWHGFFEQRENRAWQRRGDCRRRRRREVEICAFGGSKQQVPQDGSPDLGVRI